MKKIKVRVFLLSLCLTLIVMSFSLSAYAYTPKDDTGGGGGKEFGSSVTVQGLGLTGPYSGITYEITLENSAGDELGKFTKVLKCGSKDGYGAIQGYGVTGLTDMDGANKLPKGDIEVPIEDVVEFLKKNKEESLAEMIEEKKAARVTLIARSWLQLYDNKKPSASPGRTFWTDIIDMWAGNKYGSQVDTISSLWTPLYMTRGGIYEEEIDMWAFWADEIGTQVRCCKKCKCGPEKVDKGKYTCKNYHNCSCGCVFCYSEYMGWFATLYEIEGAKPDGDPCDMPESIDPVVYANIENTKFGVYSSSDLNGNPIPTSESVDISGESNFYGGVTGLFKYQTDVVALNPQGTISAEYYKYDSVNKTLTKETTSKNYSGSAVSGVVTWLDASDASVSNKVDYDFFNGAFNKQLVKDSKSSTNIKININPDKGDYEQKSGAVNYTYTVPNSEIIALEKLLELAKAGSQWASDELSIRTGIMEAEAKERVKELTPLFDVETDSITFNGELIEKNGALTGTFYRIDKKNNVIQNVVNKSANGSSYTTDGVAKTGGLQYTIKSVHHDKVNNIRVHTPINNELYINGELASNVKINEKDKITLTMPLDAKSEYYSGIENFNVIKYIQSIEFVFKKVAEDGTETKLKTQKITGSSIKANTALVTYTVPKLNTGEMFKVDATVTAINATAAGTTTPDNFIFNRPDDVYILATSAEKNTNIPEPTGDYELRYQEEKECNRAVTSEAKIKNREFKPEEGKKIPTSESLDVAGTTNLAGQLSGIDVWRMNFTDDYTESVYIKGEYFTHYTVSRKTYSSGDSGWTLSSSASDAYYSSADLAGAKKSTTEYSADGNTKVVYGSPVSHYTSSGKWVELNKENCPGYTYTVTTNAVVDNQVTAYISNDPLCGVGGTKSKLLDTPTLTITSKGTLAGDDRARVKHNTEHYIGAFSTESELEAALDSYVINQDHFWMVEGDVLNVRAEKGYTSSVKEYSNNCPVLTTDFTGIPLTPIDGITQTAIPLIPNQIYSSSGNLVCAGVERTIPGINSVDVYTPISNRIILNVIGEHTDEYEERIDAAPGQKIAQLGDTLQVTVNLKGPVRSGYATTPDSSEYAKSLYFKCGVCGFEETKAYPGETYTHTCVVSVEIEEQDFEIYSIVTAENEQVNPDTANANYNSALNEYKVRNNITLSIIGDIYDFNVRTVNDSSWKMSLAEFLKKLPAGEKGDNANKIYKYGVKLGYRAYFDLKTLGAKNSKIKFTPKFYYVSKDGSTVVESPDLYYRTVKGYKKLSEADIAINMTMSSTNGDVNNSDFKREQALSLQSSKFAGVDYDMRTGIGGLAEIILTQKNAVITKYKGTEYPGDNGNISRRWLGEVYIPASTLVAKSGATLTQVANKQNVYLEGYLLITFEDVHSVKADGSRYLNYDGMKIDREQDARGAITLPNGKTLSLSNVEDELPVVIYDISLRANNDYESEGTH